MKSKCTLTVWIVVVWLGTVAGQVADTIPAGQLQPVLQTDTSIAGAQDSLAKEAGTPKKKRFLHRIFKENYPNPNMALYLSLAVPGAGQIYNKRWWKLPIIYGAYGGLIYAAGFNRNYYRRLRDAYIAELNGIPHEFSGTRLKANDLRRLRDSYDKNKQLSYIGIFGIHLLQAAEAFVDCHLRTFDVSDDLSLHLKPSVLTAFPGCQPVPGVGIALTLRPVATFNAPVVP